MVEFSRSEPAEGIIRSKASDEGNCSTTDPIVVDGTIFLPSRGNRLGAHGYTADKPEIGLFFMRLDENTGIYSKLTPKMLRELGGCMLALANQIDLYAKAQADTLLKNAKRK